MAGNGRADFRGHDAFAVYRLLSPGYGAHHVLFTAWGFFAAARFERLTTIVFNRADLCPGSVQRLCNRNCDSKGGAQSRGCVAARRGCRAISTRVSATPTCATSLATAIPTTLTLLYVGPFLAIEKQLETVASNPGNVVPGTPIGAGRPMAPYRETLATAFRGTPGEVFAGYLSGDPVGESLRQRRTYLLFSVGLRELWPGAPRSGWHRGLPVVSSRVRRRAGHDRRRLWNGYTFAPQ